MQGVSWKLFSQTGNIETYLLLKELEKQQTQTETYMELDNQDVSPLDSK